MITSATVALALLAAEPSPTGDPTTDRAKGESGLRLVDHHAREARRQRLVTGSIGLAVAGSQLGLGIYGTVELGTEGEGMRRAATGQIVAGSIGLASSLSQLILPSPMERMQRSDTYARLRADPSDADTLQELRLDWEAAAKRARKRRFGFGGISIALGGLLTTSAAARLAADDASSGERTWAFTTLASGVGVVFTGLTTLLLPSESERSFAGLEAAQPRASVSVAPSLGGFTLQGRF